MTGGRASTNSEAGFTVVEMLVALIILALVMSFLPGTLRLSSRVWESDAIFSRAEGIAAFRRAAEERMAETMPIFVRDPAKGLRVEFTGEAGRVMFVARAATGPAGGGVYRFELGQGGSGALLLRQTLYRQGGATSVPMPGTTHISPAAKGVLAFRYFGAYEAGAAPAWHTQWPRRDALPDLVEISVAPAGGAGPVQRSIVELRLRPRT